MLCGAGLGKIKARDNAALWGTDAECKLRQPDDPFYKKFAAECSRVQIAVDIFAMGCAPSLPPCSPADAASSTCRAWRFFQPSACSPYHSLPRWCAAATSPVAEA